MSPRVSSANSTRFLAALALLSLTATTALGSVFDVLPHLKKPSRPCCTHYGECYGFFPVTYRPWPAACVANPPFHGLALPTSQTLPPPQPVPDQPKKHLLPPPQPVPEREGSDAPVKGYLLEIEEDRTAADPVPPGR